MFCLIIGGCLGYLFLQSNRLVGLGLWYTLLPGVFYIFGKMAAVSTFLYIIFTSSNPPGGVFKGTCR